MTFCETFTVFVKFFCSKKYPAILEIKISIKWRDCGSFRRNRSMLGYDLIFIERFGLINGHFIDNLTDFVKLVLKNTPPWLR